MKNFLLCIIFTPLFLATAANCTATALSDTVIIEEYFQDNSAWTTILSFATGWTYSHDSTEGIIVTDITPEAYHSAGDQEWAYVSLFKEIDPLNNFFLEIEFSWDSEETDSAMQALRIELNKEDDTNLARVAYYDAWLDTRGSKSSTIEGDKIASGPDTLSHSGTAKAKIIKIGQQIEIWWDDERIHTGVSDAKLKSLSINFRYYPTTNDGGSVFGTLSIKKCRLLNLSPYNPWDVDRDNKVSMPDVIHDLQVLTGIENSGRFEDLGDGTVRDLSNRLIWLKNANFGMQNWANATAAVAALNSGESGLTDGSIEGDWRLPTITEWEAFVDTRYSMPALCNAAGIDKWSEGDAFTAVQFNTSPNHWSSTEVGSSAWYISMQNGFTTYDMKTYLRRTWPVRDAD